MKKLLIIISTIIFVLCLSSCKNSEYLKNIGYISSSNVVTKELKNGITYELYLGDPEIDSRRVYYFGYNSNTFECIIQTSFMNESILDSEYESNALKEVHNNPNSIINTSKLELEYVDISYTVSNNELYIDSVLDDTKAFESISDFKSYIETYFSDTLTSCQSSLATICQAVSKYGYIDNITMANYYYFSSGISLYNMQQDMERTGNDTILHELYKSYLSDTEYENFLTFINSLGDWSGDTHPGHFSVTFYTSSDMNNLYPCMIMLPYKDMEKNLDILNKRLLFFADLTVLY